MSLNISNYLLQPIKTINQNIFGSLNESIIKYTYKGNKWEINLEVYNG